MSRGQRDRYVSDLCGWGGCQNATEPGIGICLPHAIRAHGWVSERAREELAEMRADMPEPEQPVVTSHVYALRFNDLVKIGFTTNLSQRLEAIPHDELVGLAPGGRTEERQVHAVLAEYRYRGEWFHFNDHVAQWISKHMPLPATPVR